MLFTLLRLDATTSESAEQLTSAICTIISAALQAREDVVIDAEDVSKVVETFLQLASHATTAESVERLARMISITLRATQGTIDAFATPEIVGMFPMLALHATTAESVEQLATAICTITKGAAQATRDAFATPAIVGAFSQLAPYATTAECVSGLTSAIVSVTEGTTQATKDLFATPALVTALPLLFQQSKLRRQDLGMQPLGEVRDVNAPCSLGVACRF